MNERTFPKTALAAAMFLALSSTAFAQTTGQTGTTGGAQAPGTTAQQPGTATTPKPGTATTPSGTMPTRSDNAQSAFRMMDSANRGYVTRAEMDRLSGFSGFDAADTDKDGRLTSEEFSKAWATYEKK